MDPKDWRWQASEMTVVPVTAERAQRLKAMGESVWPDRQEGAQGLNQHDDTNP